MPQPQFSHRGRQHYLCPMWPEHWIGGGFPGFWITPGPLTTFEHQYYIFGGKRWGESSQFPPEVDFAYRSVWIWYNVQSLAIMPGSWVELIEPNHDESMSDEDRLANPVRSRYTVGEVTVGDGMTSVPEDRKGDMSGLGVMPYQLEFNYEVRQPRWLNRHDGSTLRGAVAYIKTHYQWMRIGAQLGALMIPAKFARDFKTFDTEKKCWIRNEGFIGIGPAYHPPGNDEPIPDPLPGFQDYSTALPLTQDEFIPFGKFSYFTGQKLKRYSMGQDRIVESKLDHMANIYCRPSQLGTVTGFGPVAASIEVDYIPWHYRTDTGGLGNDPDAPTPVLPVEEF